MTTSTKNTTLSRFAAACGLDADGVVQLVKKVAAQPSPADLRRSAGSGETSPRSCACGERILLSRNPDDGSLRTRCEGCRIREERT